MYNCRKLQNFANFPRILEKSGRKKMHFSNRTIPTHPVKSTALMYDDSADSISSRSAWTSCTRNSWPKALRRGLFSRLVRCRYFLECPRNFEKVLRFGDWAIWKWTTVILYVPRVHGGQVLSGKSYYCSHLFSKISKRQLESAALCSDMAADVDSGLWKRILSRCENQMEGKQNV